MGSLYKNLKKWARMSQILGREGTNVHVLGELFKAVNEKVPPLNSLLFRQVKFLSGVVYKAIK